MADHSKVLVAIAKMDDPKGLRNTVANAKKRGADDVVAAAFRRLVDIQPKEAPGSVEHDFWRTICAFEELLREERGKSVLLSKTRLKIKKQGEKQTLVDFADDTAESTGFQTLMERNLPELTGEAIILRHAAVFDAPVVAAAERRLEAAGVTLADLPAA